MATGRTRERPGFRCTECGWQSTRWLGRCGECQAWGTVQEFHVRGAGVRGNGAAGGAGGAGGAGAGRFEAGPVTAPAVSIVDVEATAESHKATGVPELDRVLGGGLVSGAAVLLAGEPGVGKSTLLLEVAAELARGGARTLYVTGEESAAQVRLRAGRVGALVPDLFLCAETDLAAVLGHVEQVRPALLVVDSVQTIASPDVDGVPGGVGQVREVASVLVRVAKALGLPTILVGHVTKDGTVAGPRVMEHLVDVVLSFEGDRHTRLRMVRAVKNRFGPTDEVGCFDLGEEGIVSLPDPSGLFLSRMDRPVPGTCVTVALEGRRPLVAEVQALVAPIAGTGSPRRTTSGLDGARLALVLAVLQRRARLPLGTADVFAATVGGVRLAEPAVDLAVTLAVAGAATERPVPAGTVAVGEVGLAGEVRRVAGVRQRLAEAVRLGFTRALVPRDPGPVPAGLEVVEVGDLGAALLAVGMPPDGRAGPRQDRSGEVTSSRAVHLRSIPPDTGPPEAR